MSDLIERLFEIRAIGTGGLSEANRETIDKAIKALTPVLPEEVNGYLDTFRENLAHDERYGYKAKAQWARAFISFLERLALNVELYKTMHEINKHCLDREADYTDQAIWDADEIEKLQQRIAELESNGNQDR